MSAAIKLGHFTGAPRHALAYDGVSIAESTYEAGQVIAPHAHDSVLMSLVVRGDATEENRGQSRNIASQSLVFTPSFEVHGHRFRNTGCWLNMQFSDAWFARVGAGEAPLPDKPLLVSNHRALAWAARLRSEVREPDTLSHFAIEGALLLLVVELSRAGGEAERTRPRWLRMVEDAIEESGSTPLTTSQLAALAGVHASHLLRTFRRYHQKTIASYIRERRLARARAKVDAGGLPLSIIALDAGFADQSHFTRAFRQAYGETPGQYARARRGK